MTPPKKTPLIVLKEVFLLPWVLLGCAGWATLYFIRDIRVRFLECRYERAGVELDVLKAVNKHLQTELERLKIKSYSK